MQRLLQGDVGSGKTIVAALAALQAIESGRQVAFMAPTEILAEQHYRKLAAWLDGLDVPIAWLSGSVPAKARKKALAALASGEIAFAVGTHALFQEDVEIPRLGLAIVDEQHRFGVAQRLALRGKGLAEAHQLMMSATPIPRTLAMTFYADLDVSAIDEMPPGRTPVATRLVSQKRRNEIVALGRQAVQRRPPGVLGLSADRGIGKARAADRGGAACRAHVGAAVASRGTSARPDEVRRQGGRRWRRSSRGEIDVLVATTVIEVGVDVPNASLMVIEHAERFGLSQLHQLRGRVGRGAAESHLRPAVRGAGRRRGQAAPQGDLREHTTASRSRARIFVIRGPGEFLGARQSGVPLLRFADLERDVALIEQARDAADELLQRDPAAAQAHLERWLGGRAEFVKA